MSKQWHTFDRKYLIFAGIALLVLLTFAAYRSLRRGASLAFGDFFYPYLAVSRTGGDRISDQTLLLYNRLELAAKVEELQKVNRHLAVRSQSAGELLSQNDELRNLLGVKKSPKWKYTGAEIILRDPLHWNEQFTINQGADGQLKEGSAVMTVTPDGRPIFVGVVTAVGKRRSRVITLFHPSLRLAVRFGGGEIGVLNTGNAVPTAGTVPVGFLPSNGNFVPQEAVVSTGFERGIPGGIKIGELEALDERPSVFSGSPHISGTIRAAAQLNSIRFVLVAEPEDALDGGGDRP